MGRTEDLNPLGQTGEQPGPGPSMETLRTDSVQESSSAHQFAEDSTTTADGVGGRERLATTTGDSMVMPGAAVRATESLKVEAGAVLKSGVQRPTVSEKQAAHPEMPYGVVGRSVRPPSPKGAAPAVEEEDEVKEIEHEGS